MPDKQINDFADSVEAQVKGSLTEYYIAIETMGQQIAFFDSVDQFRRRAELVLRGVPPEYEIEFKFDYIKNII